MLEAVVNVLGMAAAVVLAMILVVAAKAKAADQAGTARDFEGLGLVGAGRLAKIVPLVETLAAVALVIAPPYGGPIAFALLVGFTIVLWRAREFGQQTGRLVSCACFGGARSAPISGRHFIRNAGLMGLAVAATACQWTLASAVV